MKKTKKLAALVLALAMAFSLMAVTAAAYGAEEHEHTHVCSEETIQPRIPGATCSYCGQGMSVVKTDKDIYGNRYTLFECMNDDCPYPGHATKTIYW